MVNTEFTCGVSCYLCGVFETYLRTAACIRLACRMYSVTYHLNLNMHCRTSHLLLHYLLNTIVVLLTGVYLPELYITL